MYIYIPSSPRIYLFIYSFITSLSSVHLLRASLFRNSITEDSVGFAALTCLQAFDHQSDYGPSVGMTRMFRWDRANTLGLDPPLEVLLLLLEVEQVGHHPWIYSGLTSLLCSNYEV
ncbi:hypothetical protein C8R41DRAFT_855134 [Lentinula lateritia]|uniref:Uncharacterized protein n=1 Tax=Lentinula lateritia TaxID=40482 RepID=A0ABQ8V6C4_9AGAR|nr:hypothetical protein C8R41DRAFT_855134 [Lentinula lateritia]